MDDSSNLKLKLLDDLCDKLDESGIGGNVIERDSHGRPYVNIWYGKYANPGEMFTVVVTDSSKHLKPSGCYEITPPGKYRDYFKDTFPARRSSSGFYAWIMSGDLIIRTIKFLFDREKWEKKKEKKMADNTIIEKAAESINSRMGDRFSAKMVWCGSDAREPLVLMRDEDGNYIFEIYYDSHNKKYSIVPRGALASIAENFGYIRCSIHNGFGFSDIPYGFLKSIYDEWKKEQKSEFAYAEADVLATEVMHKYRESCICPHGIVDVIFNDPATIIIWADGSKTIVKAENEKFDPEKGLAMAISKKVLGNKHDYYEVFKRYVGRYEKKQSKKNK